MTRQVHSFYRTTPVILLMTLLLFCATPTASSAPPASAPNQQRGTARSSKQRLVEEFSFLLKDLKMDHQGENNNLNIMVRFQYRSGIANSEYPDFRAVAKDIETLLANYPNKTDYWEIVNKNITMTVLNKYPAIVRVTSEVQVSPSANVPYQRSSIASRERR